VTQCPWTEDSKRSFSLYHLPDLLPFDTRTATEKLLKNPIYHPFLTSRKSTIIPFASRMAPVSEDRRILSLKELVIELIFVSGRDASLKQPREFYGRLDADFFVTPTAEGREQK